MSVEKHLVSYTLARDEPVSQGIYNALDEVITTDITKLRPPLAAVIDPDALDDLFQQSLTGDGGDVLVTFQFHGITITICSSGIIRLYAAEQSAVAADD